MSIVQRWPLEKALTSPPLPPTDVQHLVLTVPLNVLRENAETFDDWKNAETERMWRPFTQVFYQLPAILAGDVNGSVEMYLDHLPGAYRFHVFYKGGLMRDAQQLTVGYFQNQENERRNGNPTPFLDRAQKGQVFNSEHWKVIPGNRAWEGIVSWCYGLSGVSDASFGVVYSPELSNILLPDLDACRPFIRASRDHRLVTSHMYRVPPDMYGALMLHKRVLPHVQVERDRAQNAIFPMIALLTSPSLAQDHQAKRRKADSTLRDTLSAIGTSLGSSTGMQKARLTALASALSGTEACPVPVAAEHALEGMPTTLVEDEFPTPYHETSKAVSTALNLIARTAPGNDPPVSLPWRTPAPLLHTGDPPRVHGRSEVFKRKLLLLVRKAAMDHYISVASVSKKLSPTAKKISRAIERDHLLDATGTDHYYKHDDPEWNLSPLTAFTVKTNLAAEHILSVNHLHPQLQLIEQSSLDAYRYGLDVHMNLNLLSQNGGTGKSNLWTILIFLRIEGSVEELMYITAAAFAVSGDEEGNPNQSDFIRVFDEASPTMLGVGGLTEHESRMKMVMSNGVVMVRSLHIDDNGKRTAVLAKSYWIGCVFMSANALRHTISHSFNRRAPSYGVPECAPEDRRLYATILQAQLQSDATRPALLALQRVYHVRHAFVFHTWKMIHQGALPSVSMHGHALLVMALQHELAKRSFWSEPNPTAFKRLACLARIKAICAACAETFTGDTKLQDFRKMERLLYVKADHTIAALGDLVEEFVPPSQIALRCALRAIYTQNAPNERIRFEQHFSRLGEERENIPDWNYLRFNLEEIVPQLVMKMSEYMGGSDVSEGEVKHQLKSLCKLKLRSRPYERMPGVRNVGCDMTKPVITWIAAKERKLLREKYLDLHYHYIAGIENVTDARSDALDMVSEAVKVVMNSAYQLERHIPFGHMPNQPSKVRFINTRGHHEGAPPLRVRKALVTDDVASSALPNLNRSSASKFMELAVDIDAYASAEHDKAQFISALTVDAGFSARVFQAIGTEDQLVGIPFTPPDYQRRKAAELLEEIRGILSAEGEGDVDAIPTDVPLAGLNPHCFGFTHWSQDPEVLRMQKKIVWPVVTGQSRRKVAV